MSRASRFALLALFTSLLMVCPGARAEPCPALAYSEARAEYDISTQITGIEFAEDSFRVLLRIDARETGPYQVSGKIDLAIHTDRGKASACFRFGPRDFASPGPYYLPVKVSGGPGGKLPEGVYYAGIEVALAKGETLLRDADPSNNSSGFEVRHGSRLRVQAQEVSGSFGAQASGNFLARNLGDQATGPLWLRWISGTETATQETEGLATGAEIVWGRSFAKAGETVRLVISNANEAILADVSAPVPGVPEDPDQEPDQDPDSDSPTDTDTLTSGIDYQVGEVTLASQGNGLFLLKTTVRNGGDEDATDRVPVEWRLPNLPGLTPNQKYLAALPSGSESLMVSANLDLSGFSARERPTVLEGSVRVGPFANEEATEDNTRSFQLEVPATEDTQAPEPPRIELTRFRYDLIPPRRFGAQALVFLHFELTNQGGEAAGMVWHFSKPLQGSWNENGFKRVAGNLGEEVFPIAGGGQTVVRGAAVFQAPLRAFGKVYEGHIQTVTYHQTEDGQNVPDEHSEFPIRFRLGEFPGADLKVSLVVNGQEDPSSLTWNAKGGLSMVPYVKVTNIGHAPIASDQVVSVQGRYFRDQTFQQQKKGLAVGESAEFGFETGICDAYRKLLELPRAEHEFVGTSWLLDQSEDSEVQGNNTSRVPLVLPDDLGPLRELCGGDPSQPPTGSEQQAAECARVRDTLAFAYQRYNILYNTNVMEPPTRSFQQRLIAEGFLTGYQYCPMQGALTVGNQGIVCAKHGSSPPPANPQKECLTRRYRLLQAYQAFSRTSQTRDYFLREPPTDSMQQHLIDKGFLQTIQRCPEAGTYSIENDHQFTCSRHGPMGHGQ